MDLKNILIFRIGHLGDTIVALPAFWAIRLAFPKARITLLTNFDTKNPNYLSPRTVLPETGLFDDWLAYPTGNKQAIAAMEAVKLAADLRRRKFDAVFYLMPRLRTSRQISRDLKYFKLAGIERVLCSQYFKTHALELPVPIPAPEVRSESDFLLDALSSENIEIRKVHSATSLQLTQDERDATMKWLVETTWTASDNRKLIAVAPGSKWESKEWMEDRFAEVGHRLIDDHSCFPIIFGGVEERDKGDRLIAAWGIGANSAGSLSVRESAALLDKCNLYLGNDTGTMHLAAVVGTPCVAIFAAIDWPGRWLPFGYHNACFRRRVECEGCHTPDCFNAHKCLDLISSDEVYEACKSILEKK